MKISDIYVGDHVAYNGQFATVVNVDVREKCVDVRVRNKGTQYSTTIWADPSELRKIQAAPIDETNASADWVTDSFFDEYLVNPKDSRVMLGFRDRIAYRVQVNFTGVTITCVDPFFAQAPESMVQIIDSLFEHISEEGMCVYHGFVFDCLGQKALSVTFYNIIEE